MEPENEKYRKVLNVLRKSKPVLDSTEDIQRKVINRITYMGKSRVVFSEIVDFVFGWIYIEWVRKSLIMSSIILVLVFVYQQGLIIKQINYLSRQTIPADRGGSSISYGVLEKQLLKYKLSGRKWPSQDIVVTEKQLQQLLESLNDLTDKYENLLNIIEEDPELKEYLEKKLIENNQIKIKL